jgi:hypothetical protein
MQLQLGFPSEVLLTGRKQLVGRIGSSIRLQHRVFRWTGLKDYFRGSVFDTLRISLRTSLRRSISNRVRIHI